MRGAETMAWSRHQQVARGYLDYNHISRPCKCVICGTSIFFLQLI